MPEAIERKLLVPFHYFGVTDTEDLSQLRWTKDGYEASQLNDVYVFNENHKKYSFESKFNALLVNKKHSLKSELQNDFMNLPIGCYIKLEKTPKEIILNNLKKLIGTRSYIIDLIREYYVEVNHDFELAEFLQYWNKNGKELDREDIYRYKLSFARLKALADVIEFPEFDWEETWNKFLPKACAINSRHLDQTVKGQLDRAQTVLFSSRSENAPDVSGDFLGHSE